MMLSAAALHKFYEGSTGQFVRQNLGILIRDFWPDLKGLEIAGYGYARPYLKFCLDEAKRTLSVTPFEDTLKPWPEKKKNLICIGSEETFPLATESLDRLLVIHGLEASASVPTLLEELWRVLKSDGRLLIVVPRRAGLWARAEHTPFGHGTPWTGLQIGKILKDNLFIRTRADRALFVPPFQSFPNVGTACAVESFARFIVPGLAGVHVIEATKQIHAPHCGQRALSVRTETGRRIVTGAVPSSSPDLRQETKNGAR